MVFFNYVFIYMHQVSTKEISSVLHYGDHIVSNGKSYRLRHPSPLDGTIPSHQNIREIVPEIQLFRIRSVTFRTYRRFCDSLPDGRLDRDHQLGRLIGMPHPENNHQAPHNGRILLAQGMYNNDMPRQSLLRSSSAPRHVPQESLATCRSNTIVPNRTD